MTRQSYRLTVRTKVWLEAGDRFVLGDGGIELLRAVATTGSLRAAADRVGWSYRHTLAYLARAEAVCGRRLLRRIRGGRDRGGTWLTPDGRDFLRRYIAFRQRLDREVRRLCRASFPGGAG